MFGGKFWFCYFTQFDPALPFLWWNPKSKTWCSAGIRSRSRSHKNGDICPEPEPFWALPYQVKCKDRAEWDCPQEVLYAGSMHETSGLTRFSYHPRWQQSFIQYCAEKLAVIIFYTASYITQWLSGVTFKELYPHLARPDLNRVSTTPKSRSTDSRRNIPRNSVRYWSAIRRASKGPGWDGRPNGIRRERAAAFGGDVHSRRPSPGRCGMKRQRATPGSIQQMRGVVQPKSRSLFGPRGCFEYCLPLWVPADV